MKIALELTEDELDTLRAMVVDSQAHEVRMFNEGHDYYHDEIMADHDEMLARIDAAMDKFAELRESEEAR